MTFPAYLPGDWHLDPSLGPGMQLAVLMLATFVSEDLTCVTAGLLVHGGELDLGVALLGCFLGIYLGDLGLWGLGRLMGRGLRWKSLAWLLPRRLEELGEWLDRRGWMAILASRFLPGTRLPLYVAAGVLGRRPGAFALWTALARDTSRDVVLATRFGFHGRKGIAGAVTGSETDRERDPRVRFISFPMEECSDVSMRGQPFDTGKYQKELDALYTQFGKRLAVLITEPYLGGGGSYHPPKEYFQILQSFCRKHDIVFILDEVQSNFGRTGDLFAFVTYGVEPDIVVLGKGLGNGVPVAAAVGSAAVFNSLEYGEGSDTWSANPLSCAAVLATLDSFAGSDVLAGCRRASAIIEGGLVRLKELPFIAAVRGEKGGMVWGVDFREHAGKSAADWANAAVLAAYRGNPGKPAGDGIHLLGPLSKKVVRIAPPLTITETEAKDSMELLYQALVSLTAAPVGAR